MTKSNVVLGTLKLVPAADLGAVAVRATIDRTRPKRGELCSQQAALQPVAIVLRLRLFMQQPFFNRIRHAYSLHLPAHNLCKVP